MATLFSILVMLGLSHVPALYVYERSQSYPDRRWIWFLAPSLAWAVVNTAVLLLWAITTVNADSPSYERIFGNALVMGFLGLVLGCQLYLFRRADRALYGLGEIVFGAATAAFVGWRAEADVGARLFAMGAAVYIVVRGLDNYVTAMSALGGTHFTRWAEVVYRNSLERVWAFEEKISPLYEDKPPAPDPS